VRPIPASTWARRTLHVSGRGLGAEGHPEDQRHEGKTQRLLRLPHAGCPQGDQHPRSDHQSDYPRLSSQVRP
jgi:hypothetical protein